MMWNLPIEIEIDGEKYPIRNKCDYRVVLDTIICLTDNNLTEQEKAKGSLFIFYGENYSKIKDTNKAIKEMFKIIAYGEEEDVEKENKPRLMDWEHDFKIIAPQISKNLGYSVRDDDKYTHWYDFIGAYLELGECTFATVVSIRNKKAKGKKLENYEREFYKENKKMVDLPQKLTDEEQEWLDSDW